MQENLYHRRKDIGSAATAKQKIASDPQKNVWVNASAGTGKTKILTDRVLRLLLPREGSPDGTPPKNILCITFTKAGASEMVARVMKILSLWAVSSESDLHTSLEKLLGHAPSLHEKDKARRLFAQIVDTPGGLNITTIHAFCQSVLGRFTLEAGLPSNFTVMDEGDSASLIQNIRHDLLTQWVEGKLDKSLSRSMSFLAFHKNEEQIDTLFRTILFERDKLQHLFKEEASLDDLIGEIFGVFGFDTHANEETIFETYFSDKNFSTDSLRKLAEAFSYGTKTNQALTPVLLHFCNASIEERKSLYQNYRSIFLTKGGDICAPSKVTKSAQEFCPQAVELFLNEASRIFEYEEIYKSFITFQATQALLRVAYDVLSRYENIKEQKRQLDYDDLIYKTQSLLRSDMRAWVLYKLDYGIDHILVDEAQDTSAAQWEIILALLEEFFSGETVSEGERDRSVFVVGDMKQSIFSFQGADPEVFHRVKNLIQNRVEGAQRSWEVVPMDTSFRSTQTVLTLVDSVFSTDDLKKAVAGNVQSYNEHIAYRQGEAGYIEIWPAYKTPKLPPRQPWALPVSVVPSYDAQAALAERIATRIEEWVKNKIILKSQNRPIVPSDIMILVRQRNTLVKHIMRALKTKNIPVSGADRLVITDHIAVQDVLAILEFALFPEDDLTLATILKSPFIGWCDEDLELYACKRTGSLWREIKSKAEKEIVNWLSLLIENVASKTPFEAVSDLLNFKTANKNYSGWQAIMNRLGEDAFDPLEELLSQAQLYGVKNPAATVQQFVKFMHGHRQDIKRELDHTDNMVRIMTVHASKGLQAPIVILPDTMSLPKSAGLSDQGFLWDADCNYPLWSVSSDTQNQTIKAWRTNLSEKLLNEYYRLLYVALTRAEDSLIVCGALNQRQSSSPQDCWYSQIVAGVGRLSDVEEMPYDFDADYLGTEDRCLRVFQAEQFVPVEKNQSASQVRKSQPLPQWAWKIIEKDHYPPRILSPSKMEGQDIPVRSPISYNDETYRFRRGLLTHALLQYLPDIPLKNRESAASDYLLRQAPDISETLRQEIAEEVFEILTNEKFSSFFGEGSLAEVPVTGMVENKNGRKDIISGQIDRLLVDGDTVWIIDFKSNRPPPTQEHDVPLQYKNQLRAYKTLMQDVYPAHNIRCALLWTDGPFMTELKDL